jgi:hypothetical protein
MKNWDSGKAGTSEFSNFMKNYMKTGITETGITGVGTRDVGTSELSN